MWPRTIWIGRIWGWSCSNENAAPFGAAAGLQIDMLGYRDFVGLIGMEYELVLTIRESFSVMIVVLGGGVS